MEKHQDISLVSTRWALFATVAQLGSLTKAAAVLDMRQSALSTQISALERACGTRLFSRTGRGLALTALGEQILPRVLSLSREAEQLKHEIQSIGSIPAGEVRVAVASSVGDLLVNDVFRTCRLRFPKVKLQILEGFSAKVDEWVVTGAVDIALLHRYGKRQGYGEEKLFQGSSWLASKGRSKPIGDDKVPFAELNQLPLVLPSRPSGMRAILEQIAARKGISLSIAMEANSLSIIKEIVSHGDLYTVLPFHAVHREVEAGMLRVSRIVSPGIDRTVALGTTTQRPLSLAAREVVKVIRACARRLVDTGAWSW